MGTVRTSLVKNNEYSKNESGKKIMGTVRTRSVRNNKSIRNEVDKK